MTSDHHHHDHAHDHDHGHGHDDGHAHGYGHGHAPADFGHAFAIGALLNILFVAVEAAYGVIGHSMALLADAGHNLSDVLALLMAWGANSLGRRQPTPRFTYGLGGSSILAALFNAIVLLIAVGGIATEAVRRFATPEAPDTTTMMVVAGIGIAINGFTAMLFARGARGDLNIRGAFLHMLADAGISAAVVVAGIGIAINGFTAFLFARGAKGDLNIRGAFLHMLADAGISAAVVVAGLGILLTGWLWLDPALSLLVAAVIVRGTWGLLRDSVALSLDAVPAGIDPVAVRHHLESLDGVDRIHDLHIWAMSTRETALTCHLVMPAGYPGDGFTVRVAAELKQRWNIGHATLQIETGGDTECALAPENVV